MSQLVGAIDQGTTSTRFTIVDEAGSIVAMAQREHRQHFPHPGWVEHDAAEIWSNAEAVIGQALEGAGIVATDLASVGITNQRETTLVWDATTGEPLTNAIVWQDTRTEALCRSLAGNAGPDRFRENTGLPLATYFSGPKLRWLLDADRGLRSQAEAGGALFGTMDAWLIWKLTGRHATDVTNASRTMLMSLHTLAWDQGLLDAFAVPAAMLPEIVPSIGEIGVCRGVLAGVPLAGVLGDQQSAMFGQACTAAGETKNTYGTGCFLLMNTGATPVPSHKGLLTTVAYRDRDQPASYALEGSVAVAGAGVQWLRDNLGLIDSASEVETLAASVADNGGVYLVPAFSGLFAPRWRSDARGVVVGLTAYATAAHVARAMLEAVAYQTRDVLDAMADESATSWPELKVDGGMVANRLLMQFQADILGIPIVVPRVAETTVLGAAYAAGVGAGMWQGLDEVRTNWAEAARFEPEMSATARDELYADWNRAVERSLGWAS